MEGTQLNPPPHILLSSQTSKWSDTKQNKYDFNISTKESFSKLIAEAVSAHLKHLWIAF